MVSGLMCGWMGRNLDELMDEWMDKCMGGWMGR